jgi:hypothetical protein
MADTWSPPSAHIINPDGIVTIPEYGPQYSGIRRQSLVPYNVAKSVSTVRKTLLSGKKA